MTDTASEKPIVWAVCEGQYLSGDQIWAAYTDDGRQITSHLSSSRSWGIHDVGPRPTKADRYREVVGTEDPEQIDYRVIPHGDWLPDDVIERGEAAGHLIKQGEVEGQSDEPSPVVSRPTTGTENTDA